jgi:adenylosuccinate synthase
VRHFKKLPVATQKYLTALAELTGAKLRIVSVGPQREQTFSV